jgi:hypothetical protein
MVVVVALTAGVVVGPCAHAESIGMVRGVGLDSVVK